MDPTVTVALVSGAVAIALFLLTNWKSDQRVARAAVITEADKDQQRRAALVAAEEEKRGELAEADEQKRLELRQARDKAEVEARTVLAAANAAAVLIRADAEQRREKAQAEAEAYSTELRRAKDEEIADLKAQVTALREQLRRRAS